MTQEELRARFERAKGPAPRGEAPALLSSHAPALASSHGAAAPAEDDLAERFARAKAAAPSVLDAAARGGVQGATMGFGDEIKGALHATLGGVLPWANRPGTVGYGETLSDRYRVARDYDRAENDASAEAHPVAYTASQIGGAALPALAGAPATGVRGLLAGAGQGLAQGAGYSDAASARGLAGDTALGGALGVAGHGVGAAIGEAGGRVARFAAGKVASAEQRAAQQAAEEAADVLKSETGRLGGYAQDINRQVEWVIRLLDEEASGAISPANRVALEAFRKSPDYAAVVNKAAERVLTQAPASAARTAAQEAKVAALQADLPQTVANRTDALLTPQVGADVKSFLKAYAEPAIAAGTAYKVADWLGADDGTKAAATSAAGLIFGRTRAGKALWNRISRPAHQKAVWNVVQKIASTPGAGGTFGETLRRGAAQGGNALAVRHLVLMNTEPEYERMVNEAAAAEAEAP